MIYSAMTGAFLIDGYAVANARTPDAILECLFAGIARQLYDHPDRFEFKPDRQYLLRLDISEVPPADGRGS